MTFKKISAALAVCLLIAASPAHADDLVCRGANKPFYAKKLRFAIQQALVNAGIAYNRVAVNYLLVAKRPSATFSDVFTPDISITNDPFTVQYTGTYPTPQACQLSVRERIVVVRNDGKVSRVTRTATMNGSLLFAPLGFNDNVSD
jgi:hypothetical protein